MPRSVVLAGAARCDCCGLPPRWCVCAAIPPVETAAAVHVLIHRQEQYKPSSTGRLIGRTIVGARCHPYQRQNRLYAGAGIPAAAFLPERETWILHPQGDPFPADAAGGERPPPQIVLLDGTWRQAGEMRRAVEGRGRCLRLPPTAPSRYWLRDQNAATHVSTAEALLVVLDALGDAPAAGRFRLHFELHVYATLRARGHRSLAEKYLGASPLRQSIPEVLERLDTRRPADGHAAAGATRGGPLGGRDP